MYYSTRNRRRLTLETLMTMPSEPVSNAFYTYTDGDDRVEVLNDTFTLVLSRDVRKNTRIAAEIAFQIAKERPQDDVLYVNTYAGVALMKEAFSKALEKSGMPFVGSATTEGTTATEMVVETVPDTDATAFTSLVSLESLEAEADEVLTEDDDDSGDDEWQDPDDDSDDEEHGKEPSILGNLFIHDVPFGTWDIERLERDIEDRGRKKSHTVVVLNSFEFASMSRESKNRMSKDLLELRSKLGLSIVVFSHDQKRDLAAGIPGRGALGIISANAGSVQRLNDPFEHLIRHRKQEATKENLQKQAEKGIVHEAQMRGGNFGRREPYRKVPVFRSELEKYQWFREQDDLPDYHADPWLGATQKLGRELLPLARSRVLRLYFEQHPNHIFTKGQEPTEYEIQTGTYEAKEYEQKWLI